MSKAVTNKTRGALRVPLPGGKALHLGPGQTGHVAFHAVDHPPLKKLIEQGKIELADDGNEAIPPPGRLGEMPFDPE